MSRIGIIGAGQLGQMLGYAGRAMDLEVLFLDPAADPPARAAGPVLSAPFDSTEALDRLAGACDVVTYEFENVPVAALRSLEGRVPVYPPAAALEHAQDRLAEKKLFEALEIPVPAWQAVATRRDLDRAIRSIGLPLVLKTRRLGYDGKGQAIIRGDGEVESAWRAIGGSPLIAEEWLRFDREISVIGARRPAGETVIYPLTENVHEGGILRLSRAPADCDAVTPAAHRYLRDLLMHFDYAGVLALELFVAGGRLLANEFAPRVHNSGHWTIEGAKTSQFENHLRAILDLPLGDTAGLGCAAMINLIGSVPAAAADLETAGCSLHDYGKRRRPGRKLGHLTIVSPDAAARDQRLGNALKVLGIMG